MNFDQAFTRLIKAEGGYVNDPRDPGGETKFGICKRTYPNVDIKNLTLEEAREIYLRDFWDRGQMALLDPALMFQVFDFAVNSSIETAIRKLQAAAGVADDGHIGPVTLEAISTISTAQLIMLYAAERLDYLRKLKRWPAFGAGWAARIADDLRYAAQDITPPGASA